MATIERRQTEEDGVTLTLPVSPEAQRAHEQAISMQRGPLVFARAIMGDRRQVDVQHKVPTRAVHPTFPWNRGLRVYPADLADTAALKTGETEDYPWTLDSTSVQLSMPGHRIPFWEEYNDAAGPLPPSSLHIDTDTGEFTLVPYGSTTFRISVFPVVQT